MLGILCINHLEAEEHMSSAQRAKDILELRMTCPDRQGWNFRELLVQVRVFPGSTLRGLHAFLHCRRQHVTNHKNIVRAMADRSMGTA